MDEPTPLDQLSVPDDEPQGSSPTEDVLRRIRGDMPLLDHLEELRGMLIKSFIAFAVAAVLIAAFIREVADILDWPLNVAMRGLAHPAVQGLVTTSPMAVFGVIVQVTLLGGLVLALPAILYFIARFVAPGLTKHELRLLRPICLAAFTLFLVGGTFSFLVLCPATLKASIYFNSMFNFQLFWTADRYYGLLTWMVLGVGLVFEFPLLVIGLISVGVVKVKQLRHYRPHAIVGFLIVSAVITPTTDPVTFLLLALPMWGLYEAAIFVGIPVERRRNRRLADEAEDVAG